MDSICKKCAGTGWYHYDDNHGKICEECCKHTNGWWKLSDGYAGYQEDSDDNYCCKAGCGTLRRQYFERLVVIRPECCTKATKDLNHTWIVYDGGSYSCCGACAKKIVEAAVEFVYSVVPVLVGIAVKEVGRYLINTVYCDKCGRYRNISKSGCKCGASGCTSGGN